MKIIKNFMALVALFIATTCFGCNTINNHEVWKNEKIIYTFVDDSLYIDEIGNEGDCYTYKRIGNCLYLTNELGDKSVIVIVLMAKDYVWILIDNELFNYQRYGCEC